MTKDSFFDTNIIFNYSNYTEESKIIIKKCYIYIINKKGKFIICHAVLEELFKIIKKRSGIHKAVINKIKDSDYSFEDNLLISKRDIPFAKKLYEKFKNYRLNEISSHFALERSLSEAKIQDFLNTLIDETVIPIDEIQNQLVNIIHDIIDNHADCKIVASALQLMQERKKEKKHSFLFVTADAKDLDPNTYDYLKNEPKLEDYEFPELLNLMYEG